MKLLRKALAVTASLSLIFPLPVSATGPDTPEEWYADGQAAVQAAKKLKKQTGHAKNVILFVGDGMGVSTVTAARILEGQFR
jgi:alkaline phosphatase